MKNSPLSTIWHLILKNKVLRTLVLLNLILSFLFIILMITYFSFGRQIKLQEKSIEQNLKIVESLENTIEENQGVLDDDLFQKKSFADFDEVIPFIAFLEPLLFTIDSETKINIESTEQQIISNRYADYHIRLAINQKKDLFSKVLDELYKSHFLIQIIDFRMNYKEREEINTLDEIDFIIRLYLK